MGEEALVLPLFGAHDQHLQRVRDAFRVTITHRDGQIHVVGDEQAVAQAIETLEKMKTVVERTGAVRDDEVGQLLGIVQGDAAELDAPIDVINITKRIRPRTPGQQRYVDAIRKHHITFATGPAGSGKTYLAVALAVEALKQKQVRKIALVRPAVEAGESLGYLPGDLRAKINPYLRPLLDALNEMVDFDQIKRLMEQDLIEVVPLAYMRGRTLNEAFIILDEAQNTTVSQMKMFLTRMGEHSKIVVSGDVTQVDLPPNSLSGLVDAQRRLRRIKGIADVSLSRADIVRHRLVQEIVKAYDDAGPRNGKARR
jgi:phosphate starvation-inducible PhoH-like protein